MYLVEVVGKIGDSINLDVQVCVDTEVEGAARHVLAHIMAVEVKRAKENGFTVELQADEQMIRAVLAGKDEALFFGRFREVDVIPGPERIEGLLKELVQSRGGEDLGEAVHAGVFSINAADPVDAKRRLIHQAEKAPEELKAVLLHMANLIQPSMTPAEVSKVLDDAIQLFNAAPSQATAH